MTERDQRRDGDIVLGSSTVGAVPSFPIFWNPERAKCRGIKRIADVGEPDQTGRPPDHDAARHEQKAANADQDQEPELSSSSPEPPAKPRWPDRTGRRSRDRRIGSQHDRECPKTSMNFTNDLHVR
jgi:hypothetical protein